MTTIFFQKKHAILLALTIGLLMLLMPDLAHAAAPGGEAASRMYADFKAFATPFFTFGIAVAAVLLLVKAVSVTFFGTALLATALFFGSDQVIAWFRALTSM